MTGGGLQLQGLLVKDMIRSMIIILIVNLTWRCLGFFCSLALPRLSNASAIPCSILIILAVRRHSRAPEQYYSHFPFNVGVPRWLYFVIVYSAL